MISVRQYQPGDASITWKIQFNTIRNINSRDYTASQIKAWAPDHYDINIWKKRISDINPFIAELDGQVVGFADLQNDGYIDCFFCHVDYQGVGVGRALMEHIIKMGCSNGISRFYSEVSITARPFFARFGFTVVREQDINIRGQILKNFKMEKLYA